MKFHINIKGEFNNIKGCLMKQSYFITIKCSSCNTQHDKPVYISIDNFIKEEIKEFPHEYEIYTMGIVCRNCRQKMLLNLTEPSDKITVKYFEVGDLEEKEETIYPVRNNNSICHVSTIISHTAEILDADGFSLDVFNNNYKKYSNVDLSGKIIAEQDPENETSYISNCNIVVEQVQ